MKKIIFVLFAIALIFGFTQCKEEEKTDTRTLITKKIQYDVPIMNSDPNYDWWIKNIEGSDRDALLNNIFDKVLTGELQAYDYFNRPLTIAEVENMLVDTIAATLMRTNPPFDEYDTLIVNTIVPGDMDMLRFLEEWKYDENSLLIDKKVLGICPVMQIIVEGDLITRPFFWVYFDEMK